MKKVLLKIAIGAMLLGGVIVASDIEIQKSADQVNAVQKPQAYIPGDGRPGG